MTDRRSGPSGLPSRPGLLCLFAIFGLVFAGCQTIGGGGGDPEAGVIYQGTITLDGGSVEAALELSRAGGRSVLGALQTGTGLVADGEGRRQGGDRLTLTLRYEGSCPGSMTLDGAWDRDAGTFEGNATAEDCTGRAQGTFQLERR